jgi:hypothetical protein
MQRIASAAPPVLLQPRYALSFLPGPMTHSGLRRAADLEALGRASVCLLQATNSASPLPNFHGLVTETRGNRAVSTGSACPMLAAHLSYQPRGANTSAE